MLYRMKRRTVEKTSSNIMSFMLLSNTASGNALRADWLDIESPAERFLSVFVWEIGGAYGPAHEITPQEFSRAFDVDKYGHCG
jgi:hypothetical protein